MIVGAVKSKIFRAGWQAGNSQKSWRCKFEVCRAGQQAGNSGVDIIVLSLKSAGRLEIEADFCVADFRQNSFSGKSQCVFLWS